jgi:GDP-4-dehydro-6-deoxy-D-mannose reductase
MKILITGATGFVGSHLAEYIQAHHPGVQMHGIRRWRSKTDNVSHLDQIVQYHECDIKDAHNVYGLINRVKPDRIFHLAAQSFVPASWESPAETLEINVIGQCNIFEAVRKIKSAAYNPIIQIACSSEEYGLVLPSEIPIRETNPLRPLSPYAVSKVAQDFMGYQYFKSYGLRVIRTRAFNHSGPRRGEVFVDSNFAKQIAEIEAGKRQAEIRVGNLDAVRDFTDVRDIVRAYWLAAERCEPGEVYNICSGNGHAIRDVLHKLIGLSTTKNIRVVHDPTRERPSDVPILVGDPSKFVRVTQWKPAIDYLTTTLQDTLNFWRNLTTRA